MEADSVRPNMVPPAAWQAWQALTVRQQAVLRRRARGESCHSIGLRFGITKQAVSLCEGVALAKLATLAGKPVTMRAIDAAHLCRADLERVETEAPPERKPRKGKPRWQRVQDQLDQLAERWLHSRHGERDRIAAEAQRVEALLFVA